MILEKLQKVQNEIKAPKNLYNSFGKYKYRNVEGILESFKPYGKKYGLALTISDEIVQIGERIYVKAIASLHDIETSESIQNTAFARESLEKKGMDDSQITGTASSYARKYALNGLFLLDDTKDADTDEYHNQVSQEEEQKIEEISNMKIAPLKVDVLKKRCAADDVPLDRILKLYKLKSIEDMTEKQFQNCMQYWEKVKSNA